MRRPFSTCVPLWVFLFNAIGPTRIPSFAWVRSLGHRPVTAAGESFDLMPRSRVPRAVAWYQLEFESGLSPNRLIEGLRAIAAGYDDFYEIGRIERGSVPASFRGAPRPHVAMMVRPGKGGARWSTKPAYRLGEVREVVDLATAYVGDVASQCVMHEDCLTHPSLGAACAASRRDQARASRSARAGRV